MTWLDDDNEPRFTFFYLDMSFERGNDDQPLNWFTINYAERRDVYKDLSLAAVAQTLGEHTELQCIVARIPISANTWVDGDVLDDP